ILFFFFFQAEDGIRDFHVTGVQTCALPILTLAKPVFVVSSRNTGTNIIIPIINAIVDVLRVPYFSTILLLNTRYNDQLKTARNRSISPMSMDSSGLTKIPSQNITSIPIIESEMANSFLAENLSDLMSIEVIKTNNGVHA